MKVALISSVFPPRIGGPSTQTYHMAHFYAMKGIETVVVTFGNQNSICHNNGFKVYYLRNYDEIKIKTIRVTLCYANAFFNTFLILHKESPDILHHQTGVDGAFCFITGILSRIFRIPSIIKFCGDMVWQKMCSRDNMPSIQYEDIFSYNLKARILTLIERWILNNFTFIWGISHFQIDSLRHIHHIPKDKIVALPNSICMDELKTDDNFKSKKNTIDILTICRFARWKRIDNAILALSRIKNNRVRLTIIGGENTHIEEELKKLTDKLGLKDRVTFIGAISPLEIHKYYENADIFLLTTSYEPCSITLIEAQAAGLPIVATRVGGNAEIVKDGYAGLLVESFDINDLVEKLNVLIKDSFLRKRFGEFGKQFANRFDLEHNVDLFINFYQRLIKNDGQKTTS